MADTQTLDKAYHVLVSHVVETGQAHYSDLATGLGCSMEEARRLLHDLSKAVPTGIRLIPKTDFIATFTPFSLIPTPCRITVDGQQKWFGI